MSDVTANKAAPLDEVMMAMDVVDTLRHRQDLVTRELDGVARERQLIERLREVYRQQGIEVPDHILREGVAALAERAALSRSTFFERFNRAVGMAPMEYLIAWRMALAKDLLCRKEGGIAEIAERVGYGSASTFSTAFTRHVGQPPSHYARATQSRWP